MASDDAFRCDEDIIWPDDDQDIQRAIDVDKCLRKVLRAVSAEAARTTVTHFRPGTFASFYERYARYRDFDNKENGDIRKYMKKRRNN